MTLLDKDGKEMPSSRQQQRQKSAINYVEIVAQWLVNIISIPVSFVSYILAQFVTP